MKKLTELLNEYAGCDYFYIETPNKNIKENRIISKKYGFIKWLVDNDKIDFEKICHTEFYNSFEGIISFSNVEMLLMYLAISDNPIQDLISLLK